MFAAVELQVGSLRMFAFSCTVLRRCWWIVFTDQNVPKCTDGRIHSGVPCRICSDREHLNDSKESLVQNVKSTKNFEDYFTNPMDNYNEVYFPDHFCSPDVIYKHTKTVHVVQVKFMKQISKQERVNACNTTDCCFFYWNKDKTKPLKYFDEKREMLRSALAEFEVKRYVFVHLDTKVTTRMEGAEVINEVLNPDFFNLLHPEIW
ncbi:hypothetical protein HK098_006375 [Nowakowskiella sp. JEL0407]|nr:hypothetical protein HK098_006375 [Nowakowskiella sp. JEL0407]